MFWFVCIVTHRLLDSATIQVVYYIPCVGYVLIIFLMESGLVIIIINGRRLR